MVEGLKLSAPEFTHIDFMVRDFVAKFTDELIRNGLSESQVFQLMINVPVMENESRFFIIYVSVKINVIPVWRWWRRINEYSTDFNIYWGTEIDAEQMAEYL